MSPLLSISLAIAISLWAIPLTWAFLAGIRALSRLCRTITESVPQALDAPAEDGRRSMYAEALLQDEYQMLKDDVIRRRALLARTIDRKPKLDEEIRELSLELQALELVPGERTAAERLKEYGLRAQLERFQREFQEIDAKVASLRVELEEKEQELKKASPSKQVLLFKPKPDSANTRIVNAGTETTVEKRVRRIELALEKREVRVSERPVHYKSLVEYEELFDNLESAQTCVINVHSLRQLVKSARETLYELEATVAYRNTDKEFLIAQLDASEIEFESSRYRLLLEAFENQTLELREFEKKFSILKEEFLVEIAERGSKRIDFDPGE